MTFSLRLVLAVIAAVLGVLVLLGAAGSHVLIYAGVAILVLAVGLVAER